MDGLLKNQRSPVPYSSSPEHPGILSIRQKEMAHPYISISVEIGDLVITSTRQTLTVEWGNRTGISISQDDRLYIVRQARLVKACVELPPPGTDLLWMYESELGGCLEVLVCCDMDEIPINYPTTIGIPRSDKRAAELLVEYGVEPNEGTRVAQLVRELKLNQCEEVVAPGSKADPK